MRSQTQSMYNVYIKPYTFFLRDNVSFTSAHLIRSRNIKKYNLKRKREIERICHIGMSFRSTMNNGKK